MKINWTIVFVLSLLVSIFSISQTVTSFKNASLGGTAYYVQGFFYLLMFLVSFFILAFGMYASEHAKGKIKKRVALFDNWLKEKK